MLGAPESDEGAAKSARDPRGTIVQHGGVNGPDAAQPNGENFALSVEVMA